MSSLATVCAWLCLPLVFLLFVLVQFPWQTNMMLAYVFGGRISNELKHGLLAHEFGSYWLSLCAWCLYLSSMVLWLRGTWALFQWAGLV